MKIINYKVECKTDKLYKNMKDKEYLHKKFSEIVYKRREVLCYENSGNTNKNSIRKK